MVRPERRCAATLRPRCACSAHGSLLRSRLWEWAWETCGWLPAFPVLKLAQPKEVVSVLAYAGLIAGSLFWSGIGADEGPFPQMAGRTR